MAIKTQRIVELRIENMKIIKAAHVSPDGNIIAVKGKNGAGKSTVLDCIAWAMAGKVPAGALKNGAQKGEINVTTEDFIIKRVVAADGKSRLAVYHSDGSEIKGPQNFLDTLNGSIAFDPFEFTNKKGSEQGEILRNLVGLNLAPIDERIRSARDERLLMGRDVKKLQAELENKVVVPCEEVSVSGLMDELATARNKNNAVQGLHAKKEGVEANLRAVKRRKSDLETDVDQLTAELLGIQKKIDSARVRIAELDSDILKSGETIAEIDAEIESAEHVDEQAIMEKIAGAEKINAQIRTNAEIRRKRDELEAMERRHQLFDADVKSLETERVRLISETKMPIVGLAFDESGSVIFNEILLSQCSTAEKLRVSVAVAMASNPKFRVILVREGSLLDSDGRKILADLADKYDCQVWVEVVADEHDESDDACIFIEDGTIRK